jgi:leucyl aminopeptidase
VTTLTVSDRSPSDVKADALVLAIVRTDEGAALTPGHGLDRKVADVLGSALTSLDAKGAVEEVHRVPAVAGITAPLVVLVGLGAAPQDEASYAPEVLRRAAGAAVRALTGRPKVALSLPGTTAEAVGAAAEGALFGAYEFAGHRGNSSAKSAVKAVVLLVPTARDRAVRAAVKRAGILADAQNYTRDLVNTAPNVLFPQSFAESVKARAAGSTVKVAVMDEKALAKAGCGGIIGVGQGSVHPPRIVTMTYKPARATARTPHLAFVGKGITFDSGGLCIKPATGMVTMKCDMAGAATVAAAILVIAELGLPVAVTGYLCLAENMPSSLAQRPGDVVTMRGGKTVEIINTDAEGRMVMADGIVLAGEKRPDAIVDIATLTGAQVMALGLRTGGLMANDDGFRDTVRAAADDAGEAMWPMPLPEELRAGLDSLVADLKHTGERHGGMLTAAQFLREFVPEGTPWAHLDIAGPAYNEAGPFGYTPKGGTGFGLRTLVRLAETYTR